MKHREAGFCIDLLNHIESTAYFVLSLFVESFLGNHKISKMQSRKLWLVEPTQAGATSPSSCSRTFSQSEHDTTKALHNHLTYIFQFVSTLVRLHGFSNKTQAYVPGLMRVYKLWYVVCRGSSKRLSSVFRLKKNLGPKCQDLLHDLQKKQRLVAGVPCNRILYV